MIEYQERKRAWGFAPSQTARIVPGLEAPTRAHDPEALEAIAAAASAGKRMVSLCAGAFVLGQAGFRQGEAQPQAAIDVIRWFASAVPAVLLVVSAWFARGYPLTRAEHARILEELARRTSAAPRP